MAKDLAQQVAAMRPQYVTRDDVPADVVEKERRIAEQITRDEGKPEQAIPKIVEGRVNSYFKDVVLVEQAFVKEQEDDQAGATAACRAVSPGPGRQACAPSPPSPSGCAGGRRAGPWGRRARTTGAVRAASAAR